MAIQAQLYSENLGFPFDSSQDWMENACGLNDFYLFNLQQQQLQSIQHPPKNQDLCSESGFSINVNCNKPISMHSQRVAAHLQKQNQEIEGFISLQNERLRSALQTHRKQQLLTILKKYELKSEIMLREKEEEINRARNRRIELEEVLRRTEMERQTWERAAKEHEAMVINLSNTIEQLRSSNYLENEAEDAGSCCQEEDEDGRRMRMVCKSCFREDSCVVVLPCRHLCCCKSCDAFLHSCPVCKMVKKATIQLSL